MVGGKLCLWFAYPSGLSALWHQTIRTGNAETVQQQLAATQGHAARQGVRLEEPLRGGGLQVVAFPPEQWVRRR